MLKQGDTIEYTAQGYADCETVGQADGVTVFVPQLIVGEKALVKVNYVKRNVAYADVVKVLTPSQKRVAAPCKQFGKCGGCSLMHMAYDEQLRFKHNKVVNNLRKIGKLELNVLPCVPSPMQSRYRNKLSLPVSGSKGNAVIGMYCKGTHKVVQTPDCMLGGEWANTLVELFKQYLNENGIIPYNETNFQGEVRHLVARYIDNQLLVTVVSNGTFKRDLQSFADMLKKRFDKFGLFVNDNNGKNNVILGKVTKHIYGIEYIEGEHLGVKFRLRPNSFFQVNNEVKDAIYLKVKELLNVSNTQVLVDCFSGVGVLTNVLADNRFTTYAVEIEPSAVQDAKEMQALNGKNIINVCGDANVELLKITEKHKGQVLSLVVDPPRKGLGANICQAILNAEFDNIAYISCDSATLARDLAILTENYDISYIQPYDMFPNTDQVETLVHLARKMN